MLQAILDIEAYRRANEPGYGEIKATETTEAIETSTRAADTFDAEEEPTLVDCPNARRASLLPTPESGETYDPPSGTYSTSYAR